MLKLALKILAALLMLLALFFMAMYAATSPKFSVPATVKDDASLPAIEIKGVRLHAEAFGREGAPVVIVLHGGPGNGYEYLLPLQALGDRYRVVFYDQRGAGLSQRVPASSLGIDDYVAELDGVVEHYSAGRPVLLIGHSWGAMLATAYLGKHPQKVKAAVLAEPGFLDSELAEEFYGKTNGMMPPMSAGLLWQATRT
jgi:proline iminopeptidase